MWAKRLICVHKSLLKGCANLSVQNSFIWGMSDHVPRTASISSTPSCRAAAPSSGSREGMQGR